MTTPDPNPITASSPADAAFRWLSRRCKEQAETDPPEGQQDIRPVWRFAAIHCQQLAQFAYKPPENVRVHFAAGHVATGFRLCLQVLPGDSQMRTALRSVYQLLLSLLAREGIPPANDIGGLVMASCLWVMMQQVAYLFATGPMEVPKIVAPGRDPEREIQEARQNMIGLRELLLGDLGEMLLTGAGAIVQLEQEESAQAQAPQQAEATPAQPQTPEPAPVPREVMDRANALKAEIIREHLSPARKPEIALPPSAEEQFKPLAEGKPTDV